MDTTYLEPQDTGNELLIEKIRRRITGEGRITFDAFMDMALYDPEFGYYVSGREPVGTEGDYLTSPAMHPSFGAMIAKWLDLQWREMGSPEHFDVLEMGAGKGLLCLAVLDWANEHYHDLWLAMNYRVVEKRRTGPSACGAMTSSGSEVQVIDDLSDLPDSSIEGCVFSNELVDAFPVHLVAVEGGRLQEIYIGLKGDRFVEILDEPSTPEIPAYFERLGIFLPEEYRTEVNLRALDWNRLVGRKLKSGRVLTVDYGYTADQYYSPERRRGTLMCYYRHTYSEDPYIRIGHQDITAHVDFTSLTNAGRDAGLDAERLATQRDFLIEMGIRDLLDAQPGRRAIMALIDPRGMGLFKVLVQKMTSP